MRRRPIPKSTAAMSLFPFLAVLICTMGALIVLLVLVMRQARVHAETAASIAPQVDLQQVAQLAEQRQMQLEDQAWRGEVLTQQRAEALGQLADKRLQLAHLEQHIREIESRFQSVQGDVARMKQMSSSESAEHASLLAERDRLMERVAQARVEVEQAAQRAAERPRSFTIIPYPGPNGTERRPIYIECTESGIVLRPENIVLRSEDFEGPMGPGNPLDAALRTMREYYVRGAPANAEPYPLLIIRPDGIGAYVAAREAMSGWEDEFGYELVSRELVLNYPPPDPNLAARIQDAIRDARRRQERLSAAMPSYARGSGFVVSGRGGVVPLDGHSTTSGSSGESSGPNRGVGAGRGGAGADENRSQGDVTATHQDGDASSSAGTPSNSNSRASGQPGAGQPGSARQNGTGGGSSSFGSMATSRGADWALDKQSSGPTGYRRPVRVVCQREALVLMPEQGSNQTPMTFPFEHDPTRTLDAFAQSLRQRTSTWGIAPLGGFWRPQLIVDVAPDAEAQCRMIEALLRDSGLEITRNQP